MVDEQNLFRLKITPAFFKKLILFSLLTLTGGISYSQPAWVWQAPLPTGSTLESVRFINQLTGYSCGDAGALLKTTNSGENWFAISTPKNIDYKGIDNAGAGILVAVGDSSTIIRSSNAGADWQIIPSPSPNNILRSIDFSDASTGYIVGDNATIWKTTNSGLNWFAQSSPASLLFVVKFYDNNRGVIGGRQAVLLTTNGGTNWVSQGITFQPVNTVTGVAFADSVTILATAYVENVVFRTSNSGLNWTKYLLNIPEYEGFTDFAADMSFVNYNTGFMITSFVGNILKTTNSGMNWTQDSSYRIDKWYDIQMLDNNTGYICGTGGTIMNTTNSGGNWNVQTGGLRGINNNYFINASTGFCAADSGIILKTTDGGATWLAKESGTKRKLNGIHFPDNTTGYCVGDTGVVLKTTNGGENWSLLNTGTMRGINNVCFLTPDKGTAVGDSTMFLHTTNGGADWSIQHFPSSGELLSIQFIQGIGYACNTSRTYKSTNEGLNWFLIATGTTGTGFDLCFLDSLVGYTSRGSGRISKTTNGGINWVNQESNAAFNLNSIYFINPDNGIAVGSQGVMTKTTNGGANWYSLPKFTENILTSVFFTNGNTGYVTGEYGTIFKTTNGGMTFIKHYHDIIAQNYTLHQNYPNPFNPNTIIKYELPEDGQVSLKVYNSAGVEIAEIISEKQQSGTYEALFDGGGLASGVYFYSLQIDGEFKAVRKMILIK